MTTLLSTAQAAERLQVSQALVIKRIREGELPATRVGHAWLVSEKDLTRVYLRKPGRPRKLVPVE